MLRWLLVVFVVVGFVAACSGGADNDAADDEAAPAPTATPEPLPPTPAPTPFPTVDEVPDAEAGVEGDAADRLDELIGWMNGEPLDEAIFAEAFTDDFQSQVPFAQFVPFINELALDPTWAVDRVELASPTAQRVVIVNEARDTAWSVDVAVDSEGRITGALLSPARVDPTPPAVGFGDAVAGLEELGNLTYLIAATVNGECNVLAENGADAAVPIGSMFKLYVLGAVVEAVRDGSITWDDPVTIRDELDSIPSGITQDDADGTEVSVRELATRMIAISDNTATDHLIDLVGRSAVEAVQATMGHSDPSLNEPFLTTRELTILKVSRADLADAWEQGDVTAREAILATLANEALPPLNDVLVAFSAPVRPTTIEWFASATDLCAAFDWLSRDEDAWATLSTDPFEPNPQLWSDLGFKGGSEPGVLGLGWWMRTPEGESYVVIANLVNETTVIDEPRAAELMVVLRDSTLTLTAG